MPTPLHPSLPRLSSFLAVLLFCCAGVAQAQFVWIGANGTRVYSDQPPPPGTPASKILKAPGRPLAPLAGPAPAPKAPTLAEREADYRKRALAREEALLKAGAGAQREAAQRTWCDELRKSKRLVDSGVRIAEMGADGQQRFLGDAERAQRTADLDKTLAACR